MLNEQAVVHQLLWARVKKSLSSMDIIILNHILFINYIMLQINITYYVLHITYGIAYYIVNMALRIPLFVHIAYYVYVLPHYYMIHIIILFIAYYIINI